MSITVDNGYVDTNAATPVNQPRVNLAWATDFAEVSRTSDGTVSEMTYVNLTSPADRLETVFTSTKQVTDIYTKSGIDSARWSKSKRGIRMYAQKRCIKKVIDTDIDSVVHIPMSVSISVEVGNHDSLTPDMILTEVMRTVATLFDTGTVTSARIGRMTKGALLPK